MRIFLEEEYGYRYWIWNTGKAKKEILDWWEKLETVDSFFFDPSATLPFGEVLPFVGKKLETEAYMHLHEDDDSFLRIKEELFPFSIDKIETV